MKADKQTLEGIFALSRRLEAPVFQRSYVWKEEDNWEPLWKAIHEVADNRLSTTALSRPHFLGTIVLEQMQVPVNKIDTRQIIDGQQRLITLQLALTAARDLCAKHGNKDYLAVFNDLIFNKVLGNMGPDTKFKVWPTDADRDDFCRVMDAGSSDEVRQRFPKDSARGLIPNAYLYFSDRMAEWLGQEGDPLPEKRIEALFHTLRSHMLLVVIDLETTEDAQLIFETLNARGTPLAAADLVKNYLLRLALVQEKDRNAVQKLYEEFWKPFDEDTSPDSKKRYWREEKRQGRLKRSRLDIFLSHYLTLMTGKDVTALFKTFCDYVEAGAGKGQNAAEHMKLFSSYGKAYRDFDAFRPESRAGVFFYRLEQLDTTTVYPLLLEVVKRYGTGEGQAELEQILVDLESFLVRRAICEMPRNDYNHLFGRIACALREHPGSAASKIRSELLAADKSNTLGRWPDNDEFKAAWTRLAFYRRVKRNAAGMILEALEWDLYDEVRNQGQGKVEDVGGRRVQQGLHIEHLMPQEWQKHWPLRAPTDVKDLERALEQAKTQRNELIHKVGNLTLLTKVLNSSVSNGPWGDFEKDGERRLGKRSQIIKYSFLYLNQFAAKEFESWDDDKIVKRTETLFQHAVRIWPHPGNAVGPK